jgi:hypothetical protein
MPFGQHPMLGQQVDHRLLDGADQFANFQPPPTQVEQHVDHHLARTVIGNLAAAIALHQRDAEIAQQVLGLPA